MAADNEKDRSELATYTFSVINAIFLVFGCGSLGVGLWLWITNSNNSKLESHDFGAASAAGLSLAVGLVVIISGIIGFIAVLHRNRCLLLAYFIFLLLLLVVELAVGILSFLYRDNVLEVVKKELYVNIRMPYTIGEKRKMHGLEMSWDNLQRGFKCCGVESYKDWYGNIRWAKNNWVPDSCCDLTKFNDQIENAAENCGKMVQPELLYDKGCFVAFADMLFDHFYVVGIVGLLISVVQVFAIFLSICLYYYYFRERRSLSKYTESLQKYTESCNKSAKYTSCNQSEFDL